MDFFDVEIEFMDGSIERIPSTTRQHVGDDVLHLFQKGGTYVRETHLGSYPLANIRKWVRRQR